jgi:hypothetical protein
LRSGSAVGAELAPALRALLQLADDHRPNETVAGREPAPPRLASVESRERRSQAARVGPAERDGHVAR